MLEFAALVILLLRVFGVGEKKHEIGPLTPTEIEKIPLVVYVPRAEDSLDTLSPQMSQSGTQAESTDNTSNVRPSTALTTATKREKKPRTRHLIRMFTLKSSKSQKQKSKKPTAGDQPFTVNSQEGGLYVQGPYPFHPLPSNLSTCPICLCDFEPPPLQAEIQPDFNVSKYEWEPLRLMRCTHCLHKDCLDMWLKTSGRCPVCQTPVKQIKEKKNKSRSNSETVQRRVDQDVELQNV